MGVIPQYRGSTHLRPNPFYTCMIKIILAAFLIAPAHLIQRLPFLSCGSFFRFFFFETRANMQQVLQCKLVCTGTMNEWSKQLTMKTLC